MRYLIRAQTLFLLVGLSLAQGDHVPSIWLDNGRGQGNENSYHILAELQLPLTGKSYLVEEWASSLTQRLRLDILEQPDGRRNTLLSLGGSDEIFNFKPFTCSLVARDQVLAFLPVELRESFPIPDKDEMPSFLVTGIGALWVRALKQGSAVFVAGTNRRIVTNLRTTLVSLDSYLVKKSSAFPKDIRIYFGDAEKTQSIVAIEVGDQLGSIARKVNLRIRVERAEFPYDWLTSDSFFGIWNHDEVFDLPTGYGCPRGDKNNDVYLEDMLLTNAGIKKILRFDIVSLEPHADGLDLEHWSSRTCSARVLMGRLSSFASRDNSSRDYVVVETQQYVAGNLMSQSNGYPEPPELERTRQVWSLGAGGLNFDSDLNMLARKYVIDERTGQCLDSSKEHMDGIGINLRYPAQEDSSNSTDKHSVTGIDLSPKFLCFVLGSNPEYKLLRDESDDKSGYRTRVYEMRLTKEKLIELGMDKFWSLPMSIVRRQVNQKSNLRDEGRNMELTITMYLFDESITLQKAQIQLRLSEIEDLDEARLHRAIDISSCYSYMTNKEDEPIKFTLDYEFDPAKHNNQSLDSLDWLSGRLAKSIIHHRFLMSLADSPVPLDPQQITKVQVERGIVDANTMRISAQVYDRPLELDFQRLDMSKIDRDYHKDMISHSVDSSFECANSCIHFNCRVYDYSHKQSTCDLLIDQDSKQVFKTVKDEDFAVFLRFTDHQFVSAHQFVQELKHTLSNPVEKRWLKVISQGFLVDSASDHSKISFLELRPRSIRIENDHYSYLGEDYESLLGEQATEEEVHEKELALVRAKTPYSVIFNYARLEPSKQPDELAFPFAEGRGFSLAECERYCAEVDCSSFSYCKLDKLCTLSRLHKTDELEKVTKREEPFCSVFARNYLTKFSSVKVDLKGSGVSSNEGKNIHLVQVKHKRDCANTCIETDLFNCRSFYYCAATKTDRLSDCYLSPTRLGLEPKGAPRIEPTSDETELCQAYSRSLLSEFQQYYSRRITFEHKDNQELILMAREPSADHCAHLCLDGNNRCAGFSVCQPEVGSAPTCSVSRASRRPRLAELEADERCTTFVLRLDPTLASANLSEPGEQQGDSGQQADSAVEAAPSSWSLTGGLALLLVGVLAGYVASALVQSRRRQA